MSMLGQLFFIGISGPRLTEEEKKFIVQKNIGGLVLFERNIQSPEQIHALCNEIQSLRHKMPDKAPLFIAIDMEGGRIARLKSPFTEWPPLKHLGDVDSPTLSFHFAYQMGIELRSVGINLDFAPVVDVFTNPKNTVIGDRSISTDPEIVAKHASALIRGYLKAEIIPCAKHFPGHGNALVDSHVDLPVQQEGLDRLQKVELVPFQKSIRSRVPMIMTGHLKFPNVDPNWPVTMSEIFLKKIAREQCRFKGLIIADDLDMHALSLHYSFDEIAIRTMQAGNDLLLYCNNLESPAKAYDVVEKAIADGKIAKTSIEESYQRVMNLKKEKLAQPDPWPLEKALQTIGHADHQKVSQAMRSNRVPEGLIPPRDN